MDQGYFWLNEEQFAGLKPNLPTDTRGKPRVDDGRVISGIVHVLVSGCRWKDAPPVYGPRKTAFSAGRPKASGRTCFKPWRRLAGHRPRC